MAIDYSDNTLSFDGLLARLAYLKERHKYGQPEEDADGEVWDEWEELEKLQDLVDELSWCDVSATLINASFWQQYCEETCYDLGDVSRNGIVANFVNWEGVANAMVQDYKMVTLPDGSDFYVRG